MIESTGLFSRYIAFWKRHFFIALTVKFLAGVVVGFGLGVYFLPIIIADAPAADEVIIAAAEEASWQATFKKDLPGSDPIHWGEGTLFLSQGKVSLDGAVSPGPDYRLYLTPRYAETTSEFLAIKSQSRQIARIKGFKNFSYALDGSIDFSKYDSVVIWCERFSQFITAGRLERKS